MSNNKRDLDFDISLIVLKFVQLRDKQASILIGETIEKVNCVSFNGITLKTIDKIRSIDLHSLSKDESIRLCSSLGYSTVFHAKSDIRINDKNISIRSLNHTDRPLINHSTRDKYLKVCNEIGVDIAEFDKIIKEYWRKRTLGIINEDIKNTSEYSPFASHKDYLKPILTYLAFEGVEPNNNLSADYILDYIEPLDEKSWHLYGKNNYVDKIWPYLRFSFRADRGMPKKYDPKSDVYKEIHPWVTYWNNQYKGALHIRIVSYNSNNETAPKFLIKNKEQIQFIKENVGEKDELIIKIFLVEARMKSMQLPIGDKIERISSVGMKDREFLDTPFEANWNDLSAAEIVAVAAVCKIGKSVPSFKADVYVNNVGISIKSQRKSPPTIINQTSRSKILRVMNAIHNPIYTLDNMIMNYWNLRLSTTIGEDVRNSNSLSPFLSCASVDGKEYLAPLLNYFAFTGSGTADSECPADYIMEILDPMDSSTWVYYDHNNYIDSIWTRLIFSIRGKGLPKKLVPEDYLWIKEIENKKKGTLNVRVSR